MKSDLVVYTSFVSPITLKEFIDKGLLPIFILRNISNSELIGGWSSTSIHCKELSPSTELFRQKRDKHITIDEFKKKYALEMSDVSIESIIKSWELLKECSGANGIVLLGYGSDDTICHRSVLRTILNNSGLLNNKVREILL